MPRPILRATGLGLGLALACLFSGLSGAAVAAEATDAGVPDFSGWLEGPEGLIAAISLGQEQRKPLLLYFYTDWCGYCRQFERELLAQPELRDYLASIVAVRINPESGPAEAAMAQRYGVRSFPSLFVHSGESQAVSKVDRVELVRGRPVLMAPAKFIDVIKTAGAR